MTEQAHSRHLDGIYRHQRFIYDLSREYYLLGRDRLIAELAPPANGSVLEIGCGTARNLIMAATLYPQAEFYGVDLSSMMLRSAEASITRRGLERKVCLKYGDATTFDAHALFGTGSFDRIFMSYTLSMMPHWQAALRHAFHHLAPRGSLHVIDFGRCDDLPTIFKRGLYAWLLRFSVQPRASLGLELEELARDRACLLHSASLYRGYATYAVLRRTDYLHG